MTDKMICKNEDFSSLKNYTCFLDKRKILIESFWGRFLLGNSDKESRHHVGKFTTNTRR